MRRLRHPSLLLMGPTSPRSSMLLAFLAFILALPLHMDAQCGPGGYEFQICGDGSTVSVFGPGCSTPGQCIYNWSPVPLNGNGQSVAIYANPGWPTFNSFNPKIFYNLVFTDAAIACTTSLQFTGWRVRKDPAPVRTPVAPAWTGSNATVHKYAVRRYGQLPMWDDYVELQIRSINGGTLVGTNTSAINLSGAFPYVMDTLGIRWDKPSQGKSLRIQTNIVDGFAGMAPFGNGQCTVYDTTYFAAPLPVSGPNAICQAGTYTFSAPLPAAGTYTWTSQTGTITAGQGTNSISVTYTGAATDTIYAVQDNGGVMACGYAALANTSSYQPNLPASAVVCNGIPDTLRPAVPGSFTSFLWSTGATTQNLTVSVPGTYSVTATQNGCTSTDVITVTAATFTPPNLGPDQTVCNGPVVLSPGASYNSYSWMNNSTLPALTLNVPGTQLVSVTVQDANGCQGSDTAVITIIPGPAVNLGPDTVLCHGDTIDLYGPPGIYTYLWQGTFTANPHQATQTGTYRVLVTDQNGCTGADTIQVLPPDMPLINLGPDLTPCPNTAVTLDAGPGYLQHFWSNGATTQSITINFDAIYYAWITDSTHCNSFDSVIVTYINLPLTTLGNDTAICADTSVVLSPGAGYSSYLWSNAATTPTLTTGIPGTYEVTVTGLGCTLSDTIALSSLPDCVFPGDADYDGTANNFDVLALGVASGASSTARPAASSNWYGQPSPDWGLNLPLGTNYKHSDCDGSGTISAADTLPITLNYNRTHNKTGGIQGGNSSLYVESMFDSLQAGDTAVFRIMLGSATQPADSVFGIAFTVNFDTSLVDSGLLFSDYSQCWFAPAPHRINFTYDHYPAPRADMAVVRTLSTDTMGYGEVCRFGLVTIDNITGKRNTIARALNVWLTDVRMVDFQLKEHPLNWGADSTVVVDNTSHLPGSGSQAPAFAMYPNPVRDLLHVRSLVPIQHLIIHDLQGRVVRAHPFQHSIAADIPMQSLGAGIYFVTVQSDGMMMPPQKLVVSR